MKGKTQTIDFIEYISKPMEKDDIILLYRINNIIPERSELYLDFTHSLFDIIRTTYLGDDVMDDKSIKDHFNWCWNNTILSFKKEKIYFDDSSELYIYFSTLFLESFYDETDKTDTNINRLLEFWKVLFTYSTKKTKAEIESFIDLYKLFDKSLLN